RGSAARPGRPRNRGRTHHSSALCSFASRAIRADDTEAGWRLQSPPRGRLDFEEHEREGLARIAESGPDAEAGGGGEALEVVIGESVAVLRADRLALVEVEPPAGERDRLPPEAHQVHLAPPLRRVPARLVAEGAEIEVGPRRVEPGEDVEVEARGHALFVVV